MIVFSPNLESCLLVMLICLDLNVDKSRILDFENE